MTAPEILSLVWIVVVGALVIGVGFFTAWLNERALRRKMR
jgi:hypothetical protein